MKTATLPPLRVEPELRKSALRVLHPGETLSAFVEEAVQLSIERRQSQAEFLARGIASGEKARETGKYVSASNVLKKLEKRLATARREK